MSHPNADVEGTLVTVLVVDDEPDLRLLVKLTLERVEGIKVIEEAVDGPEAVRAFQRLHPPPVPTVIILDNRMPGLTGLEVAEQILAANPDQIIILFSAHLTPAVEQEAKAAGVAACLSKTEIARLSTLIEDLTGGPTPIAP